MRGGEADVKKLYAMISAGKLERRPVIWVRNEKGQSILAVYDTREQAETALNNYHAQETAALNLRHKKPLVAMNNDTARTAAMSVAAKTQLDKLALEAARQDQNRESLELAEKQKAEDRARAERELSEAQRAANKLKALALNAEGMELYDRSEYVAAEAKYKQAIVLDPENKDANYKYGITLYRNKNYNEALVALKLATVDPSLEVEKDYYMGLVFYRLNELDNALVKFKIVGASQDPTLGPSGVFYQGVILFAQEKLDPAKASFEKVIDTSKDPRLDTQAEQYLERIAGAMAYQKITREQMDRHGRDWLKLRLKRAPGANQCAGRGARPPISPTNDC